MDNEYAWARGVRLALPDRVSRHYEAHYRPKPLSCLVTNAAARQLLLAGHRTRTRPHGSAD